VEQEQEEVFDSPIAKSEETFDSPIAKSEELAQVDQDLMAQEGMRLLEERFGSTEMQQD
jgi:hypothetical protein